MKNLNRLVFLLSLSFIGLTTLDQSSHILEDHGIRENFEHVACVLENPEPQTFEIAVNNYISFDIEAGLSVFLYPSKVYSFNSRAPPRKS